MTDVPAFIELLIGKRVKVDGDLVATIVGVLFRKSSTEYEISWFANGDHKSIWVGAWRCELMK